MLKFNIADNGLIEDLCYFRDRYFAFYRINAGSILYCLTDGENTCTFLSPMVIPHRHRRARTSVNHYSVHVRTRGDEIGVSDGRTVSVWPGSKRETAYPSWDRKDPGSSSILNHQCYVAATRGGAPWNILLGPKKEFPRDAEFAVWMRSGDPTYYTFGIGPVKFLCGSPDGQTIAVASDRNVIVIDVDF